MTTMFPDTLRNSALDCSSMELSLNIFSPKKREKEQERDLLSLPFIMNVIPLQWLKLQPMCRGFYSGNWSSLQRKKNVWEVRGQINGRGRLMGLLGGGTAPLSSRVIGTSEPNLEKITTSSKPPNHHMK